MLIHTVTPAYPPDVSGMAYGAGFVTGVLRQLGHDVHVHTLTPTAEGHVIRAWPRTRYAGFSWSLGLPQDSLIVYHVPCIGVIEIPFLVQAIRTLLRMKTPKIIAYYHMRAGGSGWLALMARCYEAIVTPCVLLLAHQVWVSTDDYIAHVHPWVHKRLHRKGNIFTIPFGLDAEHASIHSKTPEPSFVFVGGLDDAHYFKGVPVLLGAMKQVNARLVIVGDGNMRARYEALARTAGLDSRVTFVGRVSNDRRDKIIAQSWALILPSTDVSEAFGIVLLEAMRAGTPVIASDLPGVRSVVSPPNGGWLVGVGDEDQLARVMHVIMRAGDDYRKMATQAHERFSAYFTKDAVAIQIRDALERL